MRLERSLRGDPTYAMELLSKFYDFPPPKFRVGTVKGQKGSSACHISSKGIMVFSSSEALGNPRIVLHEFYHHLTYHKTLRGGGTDKDAEKFVRQFLLNP
ncbi:MAG: hypothetical protein ACUVTM_03585 [Candidatus Bathyarchaeia archaeon]